MNKKHFKTLKGIPRIRFLRKISVLLVLTLITQCLNGNSYFSNAQITYASTSIDALAPTAPTDITVVASGAAINLKWNASTDNVGVEGYKVYKNEICIGQTDKQEFIDFESVTESLFRFHITAYDKAGNESDKSNVINFAYKNMAEDKQLPTIPSNIKLISVSDTAVFLTWDQSLDDKGIQGYEIFKNGVNIGSTKDNYFTDYKYSSATNDKYSIVAVDQSGNRSIESGTVSLNQLESESILDEKTDRYIIKYKTRNGRKNLSGHLGKEIVNHTVMSGNLESIELDEEIDPQDFIEDIKTKKVSRNNSFNFNKDIEYIQPDYPFTSSSTDPYFNQQWGINDVLADKKALFEQELIASGNVSNTKDVASTTYSMDVNATDAWEKTKGEGVLVAVLDTGIDITQEDLKDNIYINKNEIPNNFIDDDGNGLIDDVNGWDFVNDSYRIHEQNSNDEEWHGTSVAGIIAAKEDNNVGIAGVAPEAKILPLKVFQNGVAYTSDIIAAIQYAEKMGAKIVNCSWGSSQNNPALKEAMDKSKMLFVCAAGNNHEDMNITPVFPAAYDNENIVTVASINSRGILSAFSNYGETVIDVAAPGEHIISTFPENQYNSTSGTSMATAFVSGEAALLLSLNNDFNSTDVKQRIITTSDRLSSLTGKVLNGNKINCSNALKNVTSDAVIQIEAVDNNSYASSGSSINIDYNLYSNEIKTYLPFANKGHVEAVAFNDKIYVINDDGDFYQYTPNSNIWQKKADLQCMEGPQALVVANGKIYAIDASPYKYPCSIHEYDPNDDTWSYRSDMPTYRRAMSVAVVNNLIYIIAGLDADDSGVDTVEVYNPLTNTWSTKANLLTKNDSCDSAVVVDGKIYLASEDASMQMYDPVWDTWVWKSSMYEGRIDCGFIPYNGELYAIGGLYRKTIEEYDFRTNSWSLSTSILPSPRYGGSTVICNDKIYMIGGLDSNNNYYNTIDCITIEYDDCGDGFENAKMISIEDEIVGEIDFAGDVDFYKFVAPETADYIFSGSCRCDSLYAEVYDSNGGLVGTTQDYGAQESVGSVCFQAGKTYYVMIQNGYPIDFEDYWAGFVKKNSENKNMEYIYDVNGNLSMIKNNGQIRVYYNYDRNGNLIRIYSIT